MNPNINQELVNRKRRIGYRLRVRQWPPTERPMFTASNIHYELSDRVAGLGPGGIGAMHLLARRTGLIEAIDARLHLLKVHKPYHESDHVLNIAYNLLAGGRCLEDIELWRNDEVYLDALGAPRIPDPTTAGDFCRRFDAYDVQILMRAINDVRMKVWRQQPASFFERAVIAGGNRSGRNKERDITCFNFLVGPGLPQQHARHAQTVVRLVPSALNHIRKPPMSRAR